MNDILENAREAYEEESEEKERLEHIDKIIAEYKDQTGSLIKILHAVQNVYGYLPLHIQRRVAKGAGIPLPEISGVISFYAFFSTVPRAEYTIKVCMGTACYVRGSKRIVERLEEVLGISAGQLTEDGKFSIEITRCLGACGLAPVIMVGEDIYQQVKPDMIHKILAKY
jgi:NADH:ubiquinone oxidoreductase subunit E